MIRPVLASVLLTCVLLGIATLLFMITRSLPPTSPMTPNPIVYVEIPVTDLERASRFYEEVFQCRLGRYPDKNSGRDRASGCALVFSGEFVAQSFDRPRLSRGNASDVIVDDLGRSNEEPASSFDASKVFV